MAYTDRQNRRAAQTAVTAVRELLLSDLSVSGGRASDTRSSSCAENSRQHLTS